MKERILEFLRKENKTSSQFAEEIGVQPSSVSHIISGRNKPSLDFVIKMLQQYSDLRTDWLIFGRGEMYIEPSTGDIFNETELMEEKKTDTLVPSDSQSSSPLPDITPKAAGEGLSGNRILSQVILVYDDNSFKNLDPSP